MNSKTQRVLIIDDDKDIWESYQSILSPAPKANNNLLELGNLLQDGDSSNSTAPPNNTYSLQYASQGQQGIELIIEAIDQGMPFALVFLDMRMPPGLDGLETAKKIRQYDPDIEIVMVTAYSDINFTKIVHSIGSRDKLLFLRKPFAPEEISQMALSLTTKWELLKKMKLQNEELEKLVTDRTNKLLDSNKKLLAEISERKEVETNLLESEKKYCALLDSKNLFIYLTDCAGNLLLCNPKGAEFLGITNENTTGTSFIDLQPDTNSQKRYADCFTTVLKTGKSCQFKIHYPEKRRNKWILVSISLLKIENEKRLQIVMQDISKLKKAEADRENLIKQLQKSQYKANQEAMKNKAVQQSRLASLGLLAAGVAHEINQPLSFIKIVFSSILRDISKGIVDITEISEDISECQNQLNRISLIIDHLRTFGRDDGTIFEKINMKKILDNTMILISQRLKLKNIHLKKNIQDNLPNIRGNNVKLEQVLINLFQNSMDAIDRYKEGYISISMYSKGNQVVIEMTDNGSGIAPNIRERIFEPFFTTKEVGQGTGLGLSIVYGIIKEHNGNITYAPTDNGAGFIITLPIAETKGPAIAATEPPEVIGL